MTARPPVAYRVVAIAAVMVVAAVVGLATWSSPAQSLPDYLAQFNEKYDTSGSRLDSCETCHASSSPSAENLNPYGTDFAANNHDFAAIEGLDSDGDGFTNIDEINALTFPGDPEDNPDTQAEPEPEPEPEPPTTTTTTSPSPIPGVPLPSLP